MALCLVVLYGLRPLSLPQYYVPRQDTVSHQARDFHLPPQRSGPTTAYGMHWGSVCFQPSQLIYHARNKQGSSELGWSGHMFGRIWWVLWWESPREARIIAKRLIKDKAWYFKYTSHSTSFMKAKNTPVLWSVLIQIRFEKKAVKMCLSTNSQSCSVLLCMVSIILLLFPSHKFDNTGVFWLVN